MRFWQAVSAIIWKDIRAELRTKDIFSSMFVFALLSVIVFNFAFELRVPDMKMVAPGIVWVAVTFAGTLGLNRAFVIEQDKGSLAGLLLAPVDRAAIYFGKMLGNLLFIVIVTIILLPLVTGIPCLWTKKKQKSSTKISAVKYRVLDVKLVVEVTSRLCFAC